MHPHLLRLIPTCFALLAPTAAFSGHATIVVTAPSLQIAWDQPAVVPAAPTAVPRIVVTVNPPWLADAPPRHGHRRWHGPPHGHGHLDGYGHGYGRGYGHGYARGYGPGYVAGFTQGRVHGHGIAHGEGHRHRPGHPHALGPDRHGWR